MDVISSKGFTMTATDVKVELDSMRKFNEKTTTEFIQDHIKEKIQKVEKERAENRDKMVELTGQGGLLDVLA